jgi:predicted ester cyclase
MVGACRGGQAARMESINGGGTMATAPHGTLVSRIDHPVASPEHNRTVALRWIDAFNDRDTGGEADARTADYVAHAPDSIQPAALDGDAWIEFLGVFLEGFPDLHLEVQDSAADDEMVAQRILFTGTHTGPFRGLPPTNRRVHFSGLEINRMVDGKVAEHWFQLDSVTLFEQLGLHVVPGPRLLLRLMASPVTRLFARRRRTAQS